MKPLQFNTVYLDEAVGGGTYAFGSEVAVGSHDNSRQKYQSKLLHNIKGIIFDFDGTLFDNVRIPLHMIAAYPPDWRRIWNERLIRRRFAGRDYVLPDEYYRAFFAAMGKACFRSPERMKGWYFNRYMPRVIRVIKKHYRPRPGVQEVLRLCSASPGSGKKFMPFAVYSDYPILKERLEALDIDVSPEIRLYGPESFGAQKPAVRPFLRIAEDFGVKPEEILVVGDRIETDGMGAFNAGMRFFYLETGRKRYFRLDPYRRPPKDKPNGPSLVMYAGRWEDLVKVLLDR